MAEDAVFSCLPSTRTENICISTDLTEGEASAYCFLNEKSVAKFHKFAHGDTIISCDVGGATTDIAISTISDAGQLITSPQLNIAPMGVVSVDKKFWHLVRKTLRDVLGPVQADLTALEMTRESAYTNARTTFSGTAQEDRIQIALPPQTMIDDWPLQGSQIHDRITIVKNHNLSIHR